MTDAQAIEYATLNPIPGQRFNLEVWAEEAKANYPELSLQLRTRYAKYSIQVVDSADAEIFALKTCASFIVPQGREHDRHFSDEDGQQSILTSGRFSRLMFITINHTHRVRSIDEIKEDLSEKLIQLQCPDCVTDPIPFLTDGNDLGERSVIYTSVDKIVVECQKKKDILRQLVFMSAKGQVQSEVRVIPGEQPPRYPTVKTENAEYVSYEQGTYVDMDFGYLPAECWQAQIMALAFVENATSALVLGTGAGTLPSFLCHNFEQLHVTTIDIDPEVVDIARDHFGFQENDRLKSIVGDAEKYIYQTNDSYDIIFLDINSTDLTDMVPPDWARTRQFLEKVASLLPMNGMLVANTITGRPRSLKVFKKFAKESFSSAFVYSCTEEINEVYFFGKGVLPEQETVIERAKAWDAVKNWDKSMELHEFAEEIKVV